MEAAETRFAQHVVVGIGDVEGAIYQQQPLGIVEPHVLIRTIHHTAPAAAEKAQHLAVPISDEHAMMVGVGDEEPPTRAVRQHLARKGEWADNQVRNLMFARQRPRGQYTLLAPARQQPLHQHRHLVAVPFTAEGGHDVTRWINNHQRRPGVHAVAVPYPMILVHDHRMGDIVAQQRLANVGRARFVRILVAVHADNRHRFIAEPRFQRSQFGHYMQAVDAAVRPEIQHHHSPAQFRVNAQWSVGIQPGEARRPLRRLR
ncbi:MAG: hypothetical protein BWY76_03524 [bacterium ADurb.Bin429]|nr:MAG: hypothetical protein BWY76_03524 [bacterium ADurb.Bin429]